MPLVPGLHDIILINLCLPCFDVVYGNREAGSSSLGTEVERLRSVVAGQFPIYDIRVTYDSVVFFISCDLTTLEERFDNVRSQLVPQNYIPFLQKRGGEYTIMVGKRKPIGKKGNLANIILLVATIVSTTIAGAFLWAGYYGINEVFTITNILNGIVFFVLPVMLILGTHEMGHFLVARRFKVNASLPYFIPSIPPLGTLGAFISIRDPFPNRKALLEIGIAGPIAGFLVTIPIAFLGFYLTQMNPVPPPVLTPGTGVFTVPWLYSTLLNLFPISGNINLFPTAFAAWVGFFATALNLIPAGMLDGGHVSRALLGDQSKYLGWASVLALVVLAYYFESWILIALFVLFFGIRHPPPLNDVSKLKVNRKMLGAVALAIFLISFTPVPIVYIHSNTSFTMTSSAQTLNITNTTTVQYFNLTVENTGNVQTVVSLKMVQNPDFIATFSSSSGGGQYSSSLQLQLDPGNSSNAIVRVVPGLGTPAGVYQLQIQGASGSFVRTVSVTINYS